MKNNKTKKKGRLKLKRIKNQKCNRGTGSG